MANTQDSQSNQDQSQSGKQGFASMDKDKQREAARKGGEASQGEQSKSESSTSSTSKSK